jgi:hypothetical protein
MLSASINKDDFTEYKVKVSPDNELVFNLGTPRTASMYTESFKLSSSLSFLPSHMRIFKCAIFMWSTYINLRCANSEGTFVFIYADNDGTITGVDDDGLSYDLKLKRGWNTALLSASKDTLKSYPLDHNAWIVKGESYYGF